MILKTRYYEAFRLFSFFLAAYDDTLLEGLRLFFFFTRIALFRSVLDSFDACRILCGK